MLLLLLWLLHTTWFVACGAADEVAPPVEEDLRCGQIEDYIPSIMQLIHEGRLENVQQVLREELSDELQGELVGLALSIIRILPSGSIDELARLVQLEDIDVLKPLALDILRYITGDLTGEAHYEIFVVLDQLLGQCDPRDLLSLLSAILRTEGFTDSLRSVLTDEQVLGILRNLSYGGAGGRAGFVVLMRNVLTAVSKPTFQFQELIAILDQVIDTSQPPLSSLLVLVEDLLAPDKSLPLVQRNLSCLLQVDTELVFFGLLYDLLTFESLDLPALVSGLEQVMSDEARIKVTEILDAVIVFLLEDEDTLTVGLRVLHALLRVDRIQKLMSDVVLIIEVGGVVELIHLVQALTTKCRPEEGWPYEGPLP